MAVPEFTIEQRRDPDGATRLIVRGELDLATAGRLQAALDELREQRSQVRLDLSSLAFMDSTGLGLIVGAQRDAARDGWGFELDPRVSEPTRRLFTLAGLETYIAG